MKVVPRAPDRYDRKEEQVFRDLVRRGIDQSATQENLYLLIKKITNLPEFLNDAAAGAGGLTEGQFYQTPTGAVMVKRP